jgi:hypothetical protein
MSCSGKPMKGGFDSLEESMPTNPMEPFAAHGKNGNNIKNHFKSKKGGFFDDMGESMPTNPMEPFAEKKYKSKDNGMGMGTGMGKGSMTKKGGSMSKKHSSKSSKKTKKSKCSKPLPKGYACCMHCRKNVKILSSVIKKTKNGRNQMVGKAECGHTVYLFVKG